MVEPMLDVEVAYAEPQEQFLRRVQLPPGSCLQDAIQASGLLQLYPEIDLRQQRVGVFGVLRELHEPLSTGDRVEVYRPLQIDPKAARRARAARK